VLLETIELSDSVIKWMKHYHDLGFLIAVDDFDCTAEMIKKFTPVWKYIKLVKIDVLAAHPKNLKKIIPKFKSMSKSVLAEKIESEADYELYKGMAIDYFQGYHISNPEVITIDIHKEATHVVILQLIALLKEDASITIIRKFVRSRPDLTYKLIRYLNNQNEFASEINSITQVITLMGRTRLMRWLLLYLYSEVATTPISSNVLILAQRRAESMEREAPKHMKEKAYMAGMFTMLDILFEADIKISYVI
jgi:EAL and modified HD-GYP domain-containing signal transduction protein